LEKGTTFSAITLTTFTLTNRDIKYKLSPSQGDKIKTGLLLAYPHFHQLNTDLKVKEGHFRRGWFRYCLTAPGQARSTHLQPSTHCTCLTTHYTTLSSESAVLLFLILLQH